jgi:GxxExxY protein
MIEFPLPILYEQERVGVSYIDLILPRKFFVEVKSTAKLSIKDKLQTMAYSRDLNLQGILVNFVQNRSEESVEILVVNGHSIVERLA